MSHYFEDLPKGVWRACELAHSQDPTCDSGFNLLNQELPGGGWPYGQLIELLLPNLGQGEFQLLNPALRLSQRPVALLNTPYRPHVLAWMAAGIDPERLLWVQPKAPRLQVWAAEQILQAGTCAALLFWQEVLDTRMLRRLHLAGQQSETLFFFIRTQRHLQQASPAPLRICVQPQWDSLRLDIIKRRGKPACPGLKLILPRHPYLYTHTQSEIKSTSSVLIPDTRF